MSPISHSDVFLRSIPWSLWGRILPSFLGRKTHLFRCCCNFFHSSCSLDEKEGGRGGGGSGFSFLSVHGLSSFLFCPFNFIPGRVDRRLAGTIARYWQAMWPEASEGEWKICNFQYTYVSQIYKVCVAECLLCLITNNLLTIDPPVKCYSLYVALHCFKSSGQSALIGHTGRQLAILTRVKMVMSIIPATSKFPGFFGPQLAPHPSR